jgi:peroxiredoxin Q/BCP
MSKRTRKESPKTRSGAAPRAESSKSVKPPSKTHPASASKAKKPTGNAASAASHKAPSIQLKSSRGTPPKGAIPSQAKAKPVAGNSAARKPSSGTTKVPAQPALLEGSRAPAFRLPRDGGGTVSLADFAGKNLVLFFYPRADTPGCTREAIDFTRLSSAFAENQCALLGVSADPPKAQEAFRDKHQLVTPLISDEPHEMLEAYGVWGEKSMYGKTFQGILRTTVLIGRDGLVIRFWRNVRVEGHADAVLAAVRALAL